MGNTDFAVDLDDEQADREIDERYPEWSGATPTTVTGFGSDPPDDEFDGPDDYDY